MRIQGCLLSMLLAIAQPSPAQTVVPDPAIVESLGLAAADKGWSYREPRKEPRRLTAEQNAKVDEFLRQGVAYHVDAALVFSDFADAATVRRMFRTEQVIMLNGRHDQLSPAIIPDEAQGIGEAVADAAARGTKTAVLVAGRATSLVEQARVASYKKALKLHRIKLIKTVQGDYSYASGHAAAAALGPDLPDAVFCTSDAMAMGILDVYRAHFSGSGTTRFRLYGFDDLSLLDFDAYPIASIGYDKSVFVNEMVRMIAEPGRFQPGMPPVLVPTRFILRSTAQ